MAVITYTQYRNLMRNKIVGLTVGLTMLLTANHSMAGVITLYDGALGGTPNQNNPKWLEFNSPMGGTQSASGGVTTLNSSTNNSIYAGYSNYNIIGNPVNPLFPTLDRNAGYDLSFTVRINSQVNDGTNGPFRAGFSIIALSSDQKGIEIGFRNSDIFSQNNFSFNSIGEQVTGVSSLLSSLTTYNLKVSGDNYTLTSGTTTLLSGLLRDYTSATGFGTEVYDLPNFLFLGDNTTSARASVDLQSIGLTTNTATVPYEFSPTTGILALIAGGALKHRLKKKNQ